MMNTVAEKQTSEILNLKSCIEKKERELSSLKMQLAALQETSEASQPSSSLTLSNLSVRRFSRQLILPQLGVPGQLKLQKTSVLIVGCGGLGCPTSQYLASAGIGKLGLVDYDTVEVSNLHRQVLHTEKMINEPKTHSIMQFCKNINSEIICQPYSSALTSQTALSILKDYDIVADCTDNVATRYLLNDACVLLKKPLVSGAALRFEGQLSVYNFDGGPCYRCLFTEPPPPETVTNCSDGGVMGPIPGVIGVLQALEIIKIATGIGEPCSGKMIMYEGLTSSFRTVRLRKRKLDCKVCGVSPSITELIDYEQFCGAKATDKDKGLALLQPEERISVEEYKKIKDKNTVHLLIDVRLEVELGICSLHNALNYPISSLVNGDFNQELTSKTEHCKKIIVVCHKGNDSQKAVKFLKNILSESVIVKDIVGGLAAWTKKIDPNFPDY